MFDNIGGKIKALAMGITILGITASVIWGLTILLEGDFVGLVIMLGGSLVAWIGSFMTYGFGELIDNTRQLIDIGKSCKGRPNSNPAQGFNPVSTPNVQPASNQVAHVWRCPHCGNMISQTPCPHCQWQEQVQQKTTSRNHTQTHNSVGYHCGKCGTKGPYDGTCPNCGSSIKVYEY